MQGNNRHTPLMIYNVQSHPSCNGMYALILCYGMLLLLNVSNLSSNECTVALSRWILLGLFLHVSLYWVAPVAVVVEHTSVERPYQPGSCLLLV